MIVVNSVPSEILADPRKMDDLVLGVVQSSAEPISALSIAVRLAAMIKTTYNATWRPVDRAIQRNRRKGLITFTAGHAGGWSAVAS